MLLKERKNLLQLIFSAPSLAVFKTRVISDLCVQPFFFKPCLAFRQANKNTTLKQNSEKPGSENWQNDLFVSSVPGITFSFPHLSLCCSLLIAADEDLSAAKAVMLSRGSMPWFILHAFQGCQECGQCWVAVEGQSVHPTVVYTRI